MFENHRRNPELVNEEGVYITEEEDNNEVYNTDIKIIRTIM